MKIGELADLLRELDIFTERYIDQKDWIGRFEARGETHKAEQQKQRIDEIQQKIMALRDKELTPMTEMRTVTEIVSKAKQLELQQQQAEQEKIVVAAMGEERQVIVKYIRRQVEKEPTHWSESDRRALAVMADRLICKWHWDEEGV
jgi:citrate synthase